MANQLLIYQNATPISAARHRDWSVKTGDSYGFARRVNAAPLMAAEFAAAAEGFPIVCTGTRDKAMPTVVMGLRADGNLFVGPEGAWGTGYKPAFLRQYPFVLAASKDSDQLTLCLDESFEGANTEGRGERLFDSEDAQTAYLGSMLSFARQYQAQFTLTEAFCATLAALDPMQANFRSPDGKPAQLSSFLAVSRER